ncbi:LSU ribosomal protein L4P [Staphylothermus marinus F1]|uniref:Large ribosomal subunit protein uL4 n=1 Tax=Staphylothermus marinus (strain ATCC 43588 / DSM 3639 / JCM 9404 / F1) TaxID=399550 RepID=A3DNA5_STAMF|nr:50S ribosomal protein L4 [Staphylothermus marinus]ABN70115.1 LSU ribosomal protein L4P [Staphylothermus marinus F1]
MPWTILIPFKLERQETYVFSSDGEKVEEITLPPIFSLPVRKDLIRRAFLSAFTSMLQPKGRDPLAGKRTTARSWGVGRGLARVPRLPNSRAAFISFARGGHAAFPPRPDERIHERINKREKAYAVASAIAATAKVDLVRGRGHVFQQDKLPVVLLDDVEDKISKARDAKELLIKLGLWSDIVRSYERIRIRAGKGKMRGRRYVEPRSILFVVTSYDKPFAKAVRNFPGVDVATPNNLGILHLAPGGVPGRLTVFTRSAIEDISRKYEVRTL